MCALVADAGGVATSSVVYDIEVQSSSSLSQRSLQAHRQQQTPYACCNATFLANGTIPLRQSLLYQFLVTAMNEAGRSLVSVASPYGRLGTNVPNAPTDVTASSSAPNTVTLTWLVATVDGGSPIYRYDIVDSADGVVTSVGVAGHVIRYTGMCFRIICRC